MSSFDPFCEPSQSHTLSKTIPSGGATNNSESTGYVVPNGCFAIVSILATTNNINVSKRTISTETVFLLKSGEELLVNFSSVSKPANFSITYRINEFRNTRY